MGSAKTEAMKHLEHLCVKIGPRPVGSKENQAAADYIQRVFESCGLEVEMQEFPCPVWEEKDTRLELNGERLVAAANAFSPSCDVTAPTVAMGTVAELEAAELRGRIGIMYDFCNVVATKAGAQPERVVLLAHLDTMHDAPGAIDNGSGVAVLLALAESLAKRDLLVGLEWIAVNGEENGGLGDAEYLRRREGELEQILVVINVDGVGQQVGVNTITTLGASQPFQDQVRQVHRQYPGILWVDLWYESDHGAFFWRDVPCIALSSVGVANVNHLPADTITWISPAKLDEVVSLVTDVVDSLQDKSPAWCRESKG